MASIERTAYPRFKRYYTSNELREVYTPTPAEIALGRISTSGEDNYFNLMVLLKSFQRLGYFPKLSQIPDSVINYIRTALKLPQNLDLGYQYPQTLFRHKKVIRAHLEISQYNQEANGLLVNIIKKSALVMDNPADLINVAISELVKERYELPSFSTLDRLVGHHRHLVNQELFSQVTNQLSDEYRQRLNDLLDTLFSHFISCGTWEAVYIIEGLLKNCSNLKPETIHGDTQGQSTPVFALSYLLGINLMPRIRNWKDLTFYRPDKETIYQHIDTLFTDTIDGELIRTHWQDLFRVVLSIQEGKISSDILLRKLGNYSRKNRLYRAFRELGRVVRTIFLLEFISNSQLRQQITAVTNKVEAYHGFVKWLFFGGHSVITHNDPEQQEKIIKYNDLVANALIFQNVVDLTEILQQLQMEGYLLEREDVACLSPYLTSQIKRFGDYVIDLEVIPPALDARIQVTL